METYNVNVQGYKNGIKLFDNNTSSESLEYRSQGRIGAYDLMATYIITCIAQGGKVTYNDIHDEYRIECRDGTVEYVKTVRIYED